jgi:outer membrane immunogenic protein
MDSVLLFGTAGLAAGGVTANIIPAAVGLTNTFSGTMTGWTVGAGIEAAVTEAMTVKAEYQYVSMGGLQAPVGTLSSIEASNLSTINHVVKVGVNFHF